MVSDVVMRSQPDVLLSFAQKSRETENEDILRFRQTLGNKSALKRRSAVHLFGWVRPSKPYGKFSSDANLIEIMGMKLFLSYTPNNMNCAT